MERLAREKISFQQRLSSLRKELASHFDYVDMNSFNIPEEDNDSTTTASAVEPKSLVRLMKGEERCEAPDHPQGVLPRNWK
ncbi:uncharacterized protein TNCV_2750881 [Trichonephila clavipes]|nr:uncharacterized protein TNCV_2750881 [Trichonephila clavipes]